MIHIKEINGLLAKNARFHRYKLMYSNNELIMTHKSKYTDRTCYMCKLTGFYYEDTVYRFDGEIRVVDRMQDSKQFVFGHVLMFGSHLSGEDNMRLYELIKDLVFKLYGIYAV